MSAYNWYPVDFVFDFATTNLAVGAAAVTGQAAAYFWRGAGQQGSGAFTLDNESVAEVTGIEVFGPLTGVARDKLKYITLVIDGQEQSFRINELMAPGFTDGQPDPLRDAGFRRMPNGYDGAACTMFGQPVLAGGHPAEATPKVGPGRTISAKVVAHAAADGGAALSTVNRVRVWLCQVKGEQKLQQILEANHKTEANGVYNGGMLDCSFDVGDLETADDQNPIKTYDKRVGTSGGFKLSNWTELPGGRDCSKPLVEQYITYAQNAAATTPNSWYPFTQEGIHVTEDWQVMRFNPAKLDAYVITHMGVLSHPNIRYARVNRSSRVIDTAYEVQMGNNALVLPAQQLTTAPQYSGPTRLPKKLVAMNELISVEVMDNGTAIPAWSAINQGTIVAVYGKHYELVEV